MIGVLANLRLIPVEEICLHERHETKRLHGTCEGIRAEGVLRHPPLAVRMQDGRCLIIDGAHRTCALQQLGCRHIPVQLVEAEDFTLEAWSHLVPAGAWLEELRGEPALRFSASVEALPTPPLAELVRPDGSVLYIQSAAEDADDQQAEEAIGFQRAAAGRRIEDWHRIVDAYSQQHRVNRLAPHAVHPLEEGQILLRYPAVSVAELESAVAAGQLMPAGVTRFSVRGRLLNLRIPLTVLRDEHPHRQWETLLLNWSSALRLYSEAVYLCEV
jgi:hypothetical protein